MLDSRDAGSLFARSARLPSGYGVGFDERVVEYPWLLPRVPGGKILDAGSALNHAHVLERFLPCLDELHIVTLGPESFTFEDPGVTYAYGDLRDLPYPDAFCVHPCIATTTCSGSVESCALAGT